MINSNQSPNPLHNDMDPPMFLQTTRTSIPNKSPNLPSPLSQSGNSKSLNEDYELDSAILRTESAYAL